MVGLNIDNLIADHYSALILNPIKYGESGVFFWFPGCGMTSIEQDIFANKSILKKNLQGLTSRLKVWQLWGHLAEDKTADGWLRLGFESEEILVKNIHEVLEKGDEVVLVAGKIDNFDEIERIKILKILLNVLEINKRRVHIVLNLLNKPWWDRVLKTHPEFVALANRLEMVKTLPDNLLDIFISENSQKFGISFGKEKISTLKNEYGGILKLVKESLRSYGQEQGIEMKMRVVWDSIPVEYQEAIKNNVITRRRVPKTKIEKELVEFGVWNLNGFKKNYALLLSNPENILAKTLTEEENKLWKKLTANPGTLIYKDEVITILRPMTGDDLTLWAVDQAVSRFRKKLKCAGIDSDQLMTKKGKGYIWAK